MPDNGTTVRLADVAAGLRRRWRMQVGVIALGVLAGLTVGLVTPATYSAVSVVTVNPFSPPYGDSGGQEVSMTTERAVVQSRLVADNAKGRMDTGLDPRDLADRVSVTSPEDAQVLEVEATAESAAEAADTANAFAAGYLAVREEAVTGDVEKQVNRLDERINTLTEELSGDEGVETPGDQSVRNEINNLRERRSDLVASTISPGRVITEAAAPREPSSPSLLVFLAGGAAVGIIGGLVLALLRERFDSVVRSADRLAAVTDAQVVDLHGAPAEQAARVAMRLGLGTDKDVSSVAVIGVDAISATPLAELMVSHLSTAGTVAAHSPVRAPTTRPGPPKAGAHARDRPIVVHSAAAHHGLSAATALALRVDRVAVTTSYGANLRNVTALLEELAAVGVEVHAVVGVPDPESEPQPTRPATTSGPLSDLRPQASADGVAAPASTGAPVDPGGSSAAPSDWAQDSGRAPQPPAEDDPLSTVTRPQWPTGGGP